MTRRERVGSALPVSGRARAVVEVGAPGDREGGYGAHRGVGIVRGVAPEAVHRFLAQTRSAIAMVQIDELTDEPHQVNLPATTDQHPNWRRKQSLSLEELNGNPRVVALARIFRDARPPVSPAQEADIHE